MSTQRYPIFEARIVVSREYEDGTSRAVIDKVRPLMRRPFFEDRAVEAPRAAGEEVVRIRTVVTPLHDGGPIAIVEIESPTTGLIQHLGEGGDQTGVGIDFGGPHGPSLARRVSPHALLDSALRNQAGYRLIAGDRDRLRQYLLTKKP